MAAKATPEPKRRKGARPKQSGGPEGRGNFVSREELARQRQGENCRGRRVLGGDCGHRTKRHATGGGRSQGERCEKTRRIRIVGNAQALVKARRASASISAEPAIRDRSATRLTRSRNEIRSGRRRAPQGHARKTARSRWRGANDEGRSETARRSRRCKRQIDRADVKPDIAAVEQRCTARNSPCCPTEMSNRFVTKRKLP